jgi:hypothetical protein
MTMSSPASVGASSPAASVLSVQRTVPVRLSSASRTAVFVESSPHATRTTALVATTADRQNQIRVFRSRRAREGVG